MVGSAGRCQAVFAGPGGHYHFVGGPGGGVGGGAGWELQAPPLVPGGAALAPPHAVHLLLHTHFGLAFAREHSALGALLLGGRGGRTGFGLVPSPAPGIFICPNPLKFPFSGKPACNGLHSEPRRVHLSPNRSICGCDLIWKWSFCRCN